MRSRRGRDVPSRRRAGSQAPLAGDQIHDGRFGDAGAGGVKAESCGRPEAGLDPASSRAGVVPRCAPDGRPGRARRTPGALPCTDRFPESTTPRRPLPSRKGPSTCALTSVPPTRYERVHTPAPSVRTSPWRSERLVTATVVAPPEPTFAEPSGCLRTGECTGVDSMYRSGAADVGDGFDRRSGRARCPPGRRDCSRRRG